MLGFARTDNESLVSCLATRGVPSRPITNSCRAVKTPWARSVLACITTIQPSARAAAVSSTTRPAQTP